MTSDRPVRKLSDLSERPPPLRPPARRRVTARRLPSAYPEVQKTSRRILQKDERECLSAIRTGIQAVKFFAETPDTSVEFFYANHVRGGVESAKKRPHKRPPIEADSSSDPLALRIVPREELDENHAVILPNRITFINSDGSSWTCGSQQWCRLSHLTRRLFEMPFLKSLKLRLAFRRLQAHSRRQRFVSVQGRLALLPRFSLQCEIQDLIAALVWPETPSLTLAGTPQQVNAVLIQARTRVSDAMKLTTERIAVLSQKSCHDIASAFAGLKENQTIVVNRDRSLTLVEARRQVKQRAEYIHEAGRKAKMTPKLSILSRVVCESHLWRLAEIWSNLADHFLLQRGSVVIEVESLKDNIDGVVGSVTGCCTAHYESIICDLLQQGCTWAPNLLSVWKSKCDAVHLEVTEAAGKLLCGLTSTSTPAVEVQTDNTFGATELRRYLNLIKQRTGLLELCPTHDVHGFQLTLSPYISAATALLDTAILSSRGELLYAVDDAVNCLSRTLTELTESLSMVSGGLGFVPLTWNVAVLVEALAIAGAAKEDLVCAERSLTATPGVECPAKVVRTLIGFGDLVTGPLARLERNVTANLQWLDANLLSACEGLETEAEGLLYRLRASNDTQSLMTLPDVSKFRNAIIEILEALHTVKQLPWTSAQELAAQWPRPGCVLLLRDAFDGLWEEPLDVYPEAVSLLPLSLETVGLCNWKAEVLAFSESVTQTVGLLQLPLLGVAFRDICERLSLQVTSEAAMTAKALAFGDSALIDALAQPLRQWTGRLVCIQDCVDVPAEAWKQLLQTQNLPVTASLAQFADVGGFSPHLSQLEGVCATSSARKQFQTVIQKLECFWSKSNLPLRRQGPGDLVVDVPFALADCSYLLLELQSCLGSLASWREVALEEGAQWTQRLLCLQEYVMSLEKGVDALRRVSGVFTASATDELSSSYVLFAAVKQVWNAVLIRAYKREITGGIPLLDEARDHLGPIREWLRSVEKVQNDVDVYIRSLRLACPRFYFLSTAETIRCLVGTPESVEGVVPKLFIGVHRLVYNDSREISAVWSTEGEFLPLKTWVAVTGVSFPLWVTKLEASLASTLASQTFSIYSTRRSVEEILSSEYCEQVQLLAARALFTAQVEQALKVYRLGSLLESLTVSEKTLAGALSETSKKLLLLVAYEKTVLERLLMAGVESANHPLWRNTLRTYIFPRERYVEVRQGTWSTLYGWEYLGTPRMLVMTPLTELAFLSMTTSMQVRYGLAPLGPAGSGKTETTKELARVVGKGCIIFNCSDGLDITLLSRFFHGVASTGCWICFDEFNRLDPGTLSQVTSHVMALRTAQQKGSPCLSIDGQEVPLRDGAVVAITLNPLYAGRARLPSDLQAIMRPIAMLKADSARIISASLCAAGFVAAERLAERLVGLFQTAEAALPPSKLHDWGVRAALAVVASCSAPNPDELGLLKRAVVREISPRLSDTEAAVFMPLLDETFPSSIPHSPREARDGICRHLRDLCLEEGLSLKLIMRPAMDLLAALPYRRGHIIVTPHFALDSTVVRLLHKAFSLQTPVDLVTVYPKSVGVSGLFGYQREHVWVEGVVHRAVRCVSVWVLCRGRLDPFWVENLNSALDDNSTLCLANGQRILLSNSTKFIFEVTDVDTASPATVSRCSLTRCPSPGLYWRDVVACTLLNDTARELALECLEALDDRNAVVCRLQRLVVRSADIDADEQHKELWALGWAVGASRPDPLVWFDRLRDAAALKGLELTSLPDLLCPQVPNASLRDCVAQFLHVLRRGTDCHLLHCEVSAPRVCPPTGRVSVFSQESLQHFARDIGLLFRTRDEVLLPAGCVVSVDSLATAERDAFGSVNVCDRLLEMVCSSKCTSVIRQRFVSQSLLPGTVFVVEGASDLPQEAFVAHISQAMLPDGEMPDDPPVFKRAVADYDDTTRAALLKVGPWVRTASHVTAERIVALTLDAVHRKVPCVTHCCLKFRCHKRTTAQHRARQRLSTDGVVIFAPETVYEACAEDDADQLERWRRSHNHDLPGAPIPKLIFFDALIHAIGRTTVSLIASHVALVGPMGSGRQVVARLAATILGLEYRSLASLEDLKSAVLHIFTKGSAATPTVLLVPEAGLDLLKEAVFHLTSTCSFQFLFAADEIPAVVDILAADLSSGGHHDATPSQCWAQGRLLLERRARSVLTLGDDSDVPELFQRVYLEEWSRDILQAVLRLHLNGLAVSSEMFEFLVDSFGSLPRRGTFPTVSSHLDLVDYALRHVVAKNAMNIDTQISRLEGCLSRVDATRAAVGTMTEQLMSLAPDVSSRKDATAVLLSQMQQEQVNLQLVETACYSDQLAALESERQAHELQHAAQEELDRVLPMLRAANSALGLLDKRSVVEVKSFKAPPPLVVLVLKAVCVIRGLGTEWEDATRMISESSFLHELRCLKVEDLSSEVLEELRKYIELPEFVPDTVKSASLAAKSLCSWVRAVYDYAEAHRASEPLMATARQATRRHSEARQELTRRQEELSNALEKVRLLELSLGEHQHHLECLCFREADLSLRLARSAPLLEGLERELQHWTANLAALRVSRQVVVESAVARCLRAAYCGLTPESMYQLLEDWKALGHKRGLKIESIPLHEHAEGLHWQSEGLPWNQRSMELAALVLNGQQFTGRPVFLFDPDRKGLAWLTRMCGSRVVPYRRVASSLASMLDALDSGSVLVIADVPSYVSADVVALVQACCHSWNGPQRMTVGETERRMKPDRRVVLCSEADSVPWGIQRNVTFVTFETSTDVFVEEVTAVLLAVVRPELQEKKQNAITQMSSVQVQLKQASDAIVRLVSDDFGDILGNDRAISQLHESHELLEKLRQEMVCLDVALHETAAASQPFRVTATHWVSLMMAVRKLRLLSPLMEVSVTQLMSFVGRFANENGLDSDSFTPALAQYVLQGVPSRLCPLLAACLANTLSPLDLDSREVLSSCEALLGTSTYSSIIRPQRSIEAVCDPSVPVLLILGEDDSDPVAWVESLANRLRVPLLVEHMGGEANFDEIHAEAVTLIGNVHLGSDEQLEQLTDLLQQSRGHVFLTVHESAALRLPARLISLCRKQVIEAVCGFGSVVHSLVTAVEVPSLPSDSTTTYWRVVVLLSLFHACCIDRQRLVPRTWSRRWNWTPVDFHIAVSMLKVELRNPLPPGWLSLFADVVAGVVYGGRVGNQRDKEECACLCGKWLNEAALAATDWHGVVLPKRDWASVQRWASCLPAKASWETLGLLDMSDFEEQLKLEALCHPEAF